MKRHRDSFTNAVYYERKLAHRHLKELRARLEETALLYEGVDLTPMVMMAQFYQTRIDTYTQALRLYRKYNAPAKKYMEVENE